MPVRSALDKITREVMAWPGVTMHAHRFGGREFRLGRRELGHVHGDSADIPFPMNVRNQLVAEGRAEPHHILPESGWITLRFHNDDLDSAISLFRMAYDLARRRTRSDRDTNTEESSNGEHKVVLRT